MFFSRERVEIKTLDQMRVMRRAGLVVARALAAVRDAARPGVTTADLDAVAARVIAEAGATPNFLGYHGYPATLCASVNDEVIHGIPSDRVLEVGDVVSIDCGAVVDGWHGDSAMTMVLGPTGPIDLDGFVRGEQDATGVQAPDVALARATRTAMWAGIAALAADGGRLGAVGAAVPHPRVEVRVADDVRADEEQTAALLRVTQEAVTNAVRHAEEATVLRIDVDVDDDRLTLVAQDDGYAAGDVTPGHGLRGIAERVEALGGTVRHDGTRGFRLEVALPQRVLS